MKSLRFLGESDEMQLPEIRAAANLLRKLAAEIGTSLGLCVKHIEMQLARYEGNGTKYDAHLDSTPVHAPGRVITAILYLSEQQWEPRHGGCLRLHLCHGDRDLSPITNRLVVFPSKWLIHEVRPVYERRQALTCFIHYDLV